MATKSAIIARVAMNLVGVGIIKAVYAPVADTGVLGVPDDIGVALPAVLLLSGDTAVTPGNWEDQKWQIDGRVYTRDAPRGERYRELSDLADDILGALRAPAYRPSVVDPAVQHLILTTFGAITAEQWQRGDNAPWYLVLPFTVQVDVKRSVTYGPA